MINSEFYTERGSKQWGEKRADSINKPRKEKKEGATNSLTSNSLVANFSVKKEEGGSDENEHCVVRR